MLCSILFTGSSAAVGTAWDLKSNQLTYFRNN